MHEKERQSNWYHLWIVNLMANFRNMLGAMYKALTKFYIRLECIDVENTPAKKSAKKRELLEKNSFYYSIEFSRMTCCLWL